MSAISPLEALDAPAHVGSVSLHVRDLAAVSAFYATVLGLVRTDTPEGCELSAADGTVLVKLKGDPALTLADPSTPGLFHTAFLLPSRRDLATWAAHAQAHDVRIEGASDHLVSEAIYLSDPEGNGIEVYADRPRATWPRDGAMIRMATLPLDGASLMAEQDAKRGTWRFPAEARIGHVHLKVIDLAEAEAFYRDRLGMEVMARYPGASFLGWGGYHHHIAVNVWQSKGSSRPSGPATGLAEVALTAAGPAPWKVEGRTADPAGNSLRLG